MRRLALLVTLAASLAAAPAARGNPAAVVPTAGGAVFSFDYEYETDKATIARERVGDPTQDPLSPIIAHKDLIFHQYEHTVTPRLAIGVAPGTWLSIALPVVLAQARQLALDTGVTRASSSTLADGYLPSAGYDAGNGGAALTGADVFHGVTRRGIDQLHLGIGVAPMNQAHDPTKPTWKLGGEVRIAVGSVQDIDPANPGANAAVGRGVHEIRLWTSFDKKIGWAEPHAELFWQAPLGTTSASPFQDPGFGATNVALGQQAGAAFGFEAAAVDDALAENHISLDLGTRIVGHFEGRDYSELWEAFRLAGDKSTSSNPLVLDADPLTAGRQDLSHPGITNIENYLEMAASAALRGEFGKHVRIALLGEVVVKTDHAITFANPGTDTNGNNVVDAGTREVNPVYAPGIDLVGHRYRSEHDFGVVFGAQLQLAF